MSKYMIYKCPGPKCIHGVECETDIVDAETQALRIKDGWFSSPSEAQDAYLQELEGKMSETVKEASGITIEEASEVDDAMQEAEMFENTPEQIYKLAERGLSWPEITKATGNKAPHLAAKRYAEANDLPYPINKKD